jgi:hypothetical protein
MAIIKEQEFLSNLYAIQSLNPPSYVQFPDTKKIYNIDLNARTIDAPEFLSVSKDHDSETIYFKVNRFHDYMDLSNTTCVIQYITPDKKAHLYAVPFYDILTDKKHNMMIFPWCIDGNVTKYSGIVNFSIRFFIADQTVEQQEVIDEEGNVQENNVIKYNLIYNLATMPVESKVMDGMEVSDLESNFDISATAVEYLLNLISDIKREGVYWDILD